MGDSLDDSYLDNVKRVNELTCMNVYQCGREERYDRITRLVKEVFQVDVCQINLLTDKEQLFKSSVGLGLAGETDAVSRSPVRESLCQYVIVDKDYFVVEDTLKDVESPTHHFGEKYGIRFYAGVGLKVKSGHVIGTLCIVGHAPRTFSCDELDLLRSFGKWVTTEIELQEEMTLKESRETYLKKLYSIFTSTQSLEEKQQQLLDTFSRLLKTRLLGMYYRKKNQFLPIDGEEDLSSFLNQELQREIHTYLTVSSRKGTLEINDTQVHLLPIVDNGVSKGCFFFIDDSCEEDSLLHQHLKLNEDLLNLGSEWMNTEYIRMESHLEIQKLLRTDELTQLKNRKALNEDLKDLYTKTIDYALLFLDIDHFKGINDTYGHSVGDYVLKEIGKRLTSLKQEYPVACYRISGDEFVLLIKNEDANTVKMLAETVLGAFSVPVVFDGANELIVGVSIGVSVSSGNEVDDFKSTIQRADRYMYDSKRSGGNRITME